MKTASISENILVLQVACLVSPVILAVMQTCSVRLNPDLNDKMTVSWLMQDLLVRNSSSSLECATRCLQESSCVTFMVDTKRRRCRMHAARITRYNVLLDAAGFRSYDTCRAGKVHGEMCSSTNDCAMLYSVCADFTCQCTYGWSYSPTDLICVKDCILYGTEFTHFTETYLSLTTTLVLTDIQYFSVASCSDACVTNSAFVCRSFYLNNNGKTCTLLNVTPAEDPVAILTGLLPLNVDFYQRQCQYVG